MMKSIGYIVGLIIVIPLIYYIVNTFFLNGNGSKEQDISIYIQNSFVDTIILPEKNENRERSFTPILRRGGGSTAYYSQFIYFDSFYKRYLAVGNFIEFEKDWHGRDRNGLLLDTPLTLSVRINNTQLNNPAYGTKKNPVPVFPIDVLNIDTARDMYKIFHVSDTVNRIFVEQYLNHFMPKGEFKKTFRSNGK